MSKATGAKKPSESLKAKAFWAKKAAKDTVIQLAKKTFRERTKTPGFVGRAPQRPNHSLGKSFKVLGEPPTEAGH